MQLILHSRLETEERLEGGEKSKQAKKNSSDASELDLWSQRLVDLLHQPIEGASVHSFGQGITGRQRLLETERADHL